MAFYCKSIHDGSEVLVRKMLEVEGNVGGGFDRKLGSDTSHVCSK